MESYLSKFKAGEYVDPAMLELEQFKKLEESNKVFKEKQDRLDYIRELNGDPTYDMDEKEAVTYAGEMGVTDTFRGAGQLLAKGFNIESLDEKLKKDYKKLEKIFENPEYGQQAFVSFLTSAIAGDPASYVPIVGWMKKANQTKTLWNVTQYAGKSAAVVSGLGYTPEESPGLLTDENSGFILKKLEQIGIGYAAGVTLVGLGASAVDIVYKAKTGKSIFTGADEIPASAKDSNTKLDENETITNRPLQVGDHITAPDRGNTGQIVKINEEDGVARVRFINKENGTVATKNFKLDDLQPPKKGEAKKSTTDPIDEEVKRPAEVIFTTNKAGEIITRDPKTKTQYRIYKAIDEKGKVLSGQWEIRTTLDLKRKKGESIANLKKRKTTITVVKSKAKAKEFVKNQIEPSFVPERKIPQTKKEIAKEVVELNLNPPSKNTTPLLDRWRDGGGEAVVEAMRRNPIESISAVAGGAYGYKYDEDPRLTTQQRMFQGILGASAAWGSTRGLKKLDEKFLDGDVFRTMERSLVSEYGLDANHIARRQQFTTDKNTILKAFGDISEEIGKEATEEQQQILYQLMSGQVPDVGKLHRNLVNLSKEGRELITKYGSELVRRGLLSEEVFQKNIDEYIHRSYLYHEANNLNKTKTQFSDASKKVRLIGDELKSRGINERVSRKKFEDPEGPWQKDGTWEIIKDKKGEKKPTDTLKIRRQLTKKEREDLEEIENASFALLETGKLLSNDVAAARYFDDIAADTNVTITKEQWELLPPKQQKEYVLIPDSKIADTNVPKFGKNLTGKYVQIDVANDIAHTFNLRKQTLDIVTDRSTVGQAAEYSKEGLKKAQTLWKKMKTIYNPATHAGNISSNFMLMDLAAGVPIKYFGKALKEMLKSKIAGKRTSIYEQSLIDGIADSTLISKEFNKKGGSIIEKEMLELAEAHGFIKKGKDFDLGGFKVNPRYYWNYVTNIAKKMSKYSLDQMEDLYQAEDTVFRLATYMHRLDQGKGRQQAALDAKHFFVDYNINAPAVNAARETVLPFISYTYRAVPLVAFGAIKNPAKLGKWALGLYAINEASNIYMEDDGRINELTMRDSVNKNMFGIPLLPKTNLRMPYNDKYNQSVYLDVQRYMPGGIVFDQRNKESVSILPEYIPSILQPGGLYWDAIVTATGKDPFTGEDLTDLSATEKLIHFAERFGPNVPYLNPYSFSSEAVRKAKVAETGMTEEGRPVSSSPYSATKTPAIEILKGLGIRFNPQNEQVNVQAAFYRIDSEIENLEKEIQKNNRAINHGNITEEKHTKKQQKLEDAIGILKLQKAALIEKTSEIWSDRLREAEKVRTETSGRFDYLKEDFATGGFVEGEDNVPFTKQNPAERVNPLTGMPYKQADLTEGGILAGLLRDRKDRVGFNKGGELSNDEVIKDFILKAEDVALYNDYKAGNLEKIVKAHTGSERFKDLHGKSDKETLAGVTGSGVSETTVGDAVDNVLQKALNETQQEYNRLVPEDVQNNRSVNDQRAFFSLLFNVGATKLQNSNALKAFREGRMSDFYKEGFDRDFGFTKVTGSDGEKRKDIGLVNRRKAELKLAQGSLESPMKIEEVVLPTRVSLKERLAKRAEND